MQFIPSAIEAAQKASSRDDVLGLSGQTSPAKTVESGGFFASLLAKASEGTEARPGASLRSILLQKGNEGKNPDLRDAKLTAQDFAAIKDPLKKVGIPKDILRDLEEKSESEGLTWNQLLGALAQHPDFRTSLGVPQKLDNATKNDVTAFMQKLGMSPSEASGLLSSMENGDIASAWQSLTNKISKLSPQQKITIHASDARGLAKALQLDKEATERLISKFTKLDGQELTPKQLSSALAEISSSIQQRQQKADTRFSTLRDALKPAMEQAWERSSHLESADARASRETHISLTMMRDNVTAKANGFGKSAASNAENKDVTREARSDGENFTFKPSANKGQLHQPLSPDTSGSKHNMDDDSGKGDSQKGTAGKKSDGWSNILGRIGMSESREQFQTTGTQHQNLDRPTLNQRVFDQVQNGMLRTLKNGGKQMTLKLNPEELGSVTVILAVKNKEVSAIIKPESAEAAKAVNEQLANLKQSLENQGLKVDKLEVRQELQQQADGRQNWQGTSQHNSTHDQAKKFFNQRRLSALREQGEELARDMRKEVQRATSSTSVGLSIIA